jgi:hypothetical protein
MGMKRPGFLSRMFGGEARMLARTEQVREDLEERLVAAERRTFADNEALRVEIGALTRRGEEQAGQLKRSVQGLGETLANHLAKLEDRVETVARAQSNEVLLTDRIGGRPFRAFVGEDRRLRARIDRCGQGLDKPPVAVLSIPKSGTYLIGLLLERLGYQDSELHVSQTFLTDYRQLSIADKRSKASQHVFHLPIGASAALVDDGQFVVGHLHAENYAHTALRGFRKIFLYRNLVDATLSHLRFFIDTGRAPPEAAWARMSPSPEQALTFLADMGEELFNRTYFPVMGWLEDPEVFTMPFETLAGDGDEAERAARLAALAAFLDTDVDLLDLLTTEVLGKPTKTLSNRRTEAEIYLDDAVRQAFRDLGVNAGHERLGYPPV